jgi:hypothetical protein
MSRPSSRPMRVRMSRPEIADELTDALASGDCFCARVDEETLLVVHRFAKDDHEARIELEFFLRAWSNGGATAEIV